MILFLIFRKYLPQRIALQTKKQLGKILNIHLIDFDLKTGIVVSFFNVKDRIPI